MTSPPAVKSIPSPAAADASIVPKLLNVQANPAVPRIPSPSETETNPFDATVNGFCVVGLLRMTVWVYVAPIGSPLAGFYSPFIDYCAGQYVANHGIGKGTCAADTRNAC